MPLLAGVLMEIKNQYTCKESLALVQRLLCLIVHLPTLKVLPAHWDQMQVFNVKVHKFKLTILIVEGTFHYNMDHIHIHLRYNTRIINTFRTYNNSILHLMLCVFNSFWIMFTALRLKFGQLFKPAISITNCFHFANVMITVVTWCWVYPMTWL